MRTVDSMAVDLLVQVLSQLGSSWEAMDFCLFVCEESGEFLAIFAVAIKLCAALPVPGWLGLLCRALGELVDTELTQLAHGRFCQLA
jgi:hypothetical protein